MRPSDTGRSTNCLINDVGIYIHQKERGYHNYAVPYSWDVRMGHKTRRQALEELNDDLDLDRVRAILSEVGYDEDRLTGASGHKRLAAYYVAAGDVSERELHHHLASRLPPQLLPQHFKRLDAFPLTPNGKVDLAALPPIEATGEPASDELVPVGPVQERIAAIWRGILRVDRIAADRSFFELGGNSLAAMEVVLQLCTEFQIDLPLQSVFQYPTVAALAGAVEDQIVEEVALLSEEEADRLATDPGGGT